MCSLGAPCCIQFEQYELIEGLFSGDFVYLQDFYQKINQNGHSRLRVACPHCEGEFEVETIPLGE